MDEHYAAPLRVREIARRAHFSPYHFIRLFRRAFSHTPHQYLVRRRLIKAKQLLAETELSVTEVCLTVGFQSLGSFSHLFRLWTGDAPARYRARLRARRQAAQRAIPGCFLLHHHPPG